MAGGGSTSKSSVLDWTKDDVSEWLQSIKLYKYRELFIEHSIDGPALLLMTDNDLRNYPLSLPVKYLQI